MIISIESETIKTKSTVEELNNVLRNGKISLLKNPENTSRYGVGGIYLFQNDKQIENGYVIRWENGEYELLYGKLETDDTDTPYIFDKEISVLRLDTQFKEKILKNVFSADDIGVIDWMESQLK